MNKSILCTALLLNTLSYAAEESPDAEIALLETEALYPSLPPPDELDIFPTLRKHKSPLLTVGLSTLLPGLGHAYLGDYRTATTLFGSFALIANFELKPVDFVEEYNFISTFNIWSYSIYAAYRDVRAFNGDSGYCYKMPTDSLNDLILAPFQLSILKKPEVWGGLLGALTAAVGVGYLHYTHTHPSASTSHESPSPLHAFPVAIGEEALFRGFLQSRLAETVTPGWAIAISALAFGAVHIPNAQYLDPPDRRGYYTYSLPVITAFGAYFGWLTYKNHSLKESVALHSWYDFILFLTASAASSAALSRPTFALALTF
jgi:membrane protease YdiL (CAAX protease family)